MDSRSTESTIQTPVKSFLEIHFNVFLIQHDIPPDHLKLGARATVSQDKRNNTHKFIGIPKTLSNGMRPG